MNEREKEQMIAHLLRVSQSERDRSLQNDPTFFQILGRTYDEDFISRMLAYVFKHDKNCVWKLIGYWKKCRAFSAEEGCPTDFKGDSVACEKLYVELKFTDNDPGKVVFQEVIKRYGVKPEASVISRFVKNADFGIDVQNRICAWEGQWFVLTKKEFDCTHEVLSSAWYDELLREAKHTLTEYRKEMDTVFSKFTQWRNGTL